jgi:AmmeMemoRadiSam system protein A
MSGVLTAEQQRSLLDIARAAISSAVSGTPWGGPACGPDFPAASGVFVTIKRAGRLRGCLGTLQLRTDLASEVARCAVDSAREDPRFPPLSPAELADIGLEISVLGPLERIPAAPGAFTIGRHGLVVEQGYFRGLLLPQVAVEWGWTPEQFLAQTCVKAGLPPDAWRDANLYRFAAEVFGESC